MIQFFGKYLLFLHYQIMTLKDNIGKKQAKPKHLRHITRQGYSNRTISGTSLDRGTQTNQN